MAQYNTPMFLRWFISLGSLILLAACSALPVILNWTITKEGYRIHSDIAYGKDARQLLDIYVPDGLQKPAPVIIFFYGGSWKSGSKADYLALGQAFASKGFITVIGDYRIYPQVKYPAFVQDGATILRYVHDHISEYGGNPANLFLSGHSAGAYIAVMLTAEEEFLTQAGAKRSWIRGTIGIAGPYDFLPFTDEDVKDIFSTARDTDTQPINHITSKLPPMLLATGDADTVVDMKNTQNVSAKLHGFKSEVIKKTYPDIGHIGIILSLAKGFRHKTSLLEDIADFIHSHEQKDAS